MPRSFPLLTFGSPFAALSAVFCCVPASFFRWSCCPLRLPSAPRTPRQGTQSVAPRDPPQKRHSHTSSPITAPPILSHPVHPIHSTFHNLQCLLRLSLARPVSVPGLSHLSHTPHFALLSRPSSPFPQPPPPRTPTAVSSLFLFSFSSLVLSVSAGIVRCYITPFFSRPFFCIRISSARPLHLPKRQPFPTTFIRSRPQTRPYLELDCPWQSRRCIQCNNTEATSYPTPPDKADILFTSDLFSARPLRYSSPLSIGLKRTLAVFKTSNYPRAFDLPPHHV